MEQGVLRLGKKDRRACGPDCERLLHCVLHRGGYEGNGAIMIGGLEDN